MHSVFSERSFTNYFGIKLYNHIQQNARRKMGDISVCVCFPSSFFFFFGALTTLTPPPPVLSADTQPGMRCGRRAGLELVDGASLPPSQSSTTVREGE